MPAALATPPYRPISRVRSSLVRVLAPLVVTAAAVTLAACGTGTAATKPGSPVRVSVAVVPITDAAPFMLAVQRGYVARAGLDVTYAITPQSTTATACGCTAASM